MPKLKAAIAIDRRAQIDAEIAALQAERSALLQDDDLQNIIATAVQAALAVALGRKAR